MRQDLGSPVSLTGDLEISVSESFRDSAYRYCWGYELYVSIQLSLVTNLVIEIRRSNAV